MRSSSWSEDPGAFFARHPIAYRVSLAAAGGAAVTFAAKAMRGEGHRRLGWAALSVLEAVQLGGVWWTRHRATRQLLPSANDNEWRHG